MKACAFLGLCLFLGLGYSDAQQSTANPGPKCPSTRDQISFLPYEGDCTKYYECFNGDRYVMKCPPGLFWKEETSRCEYPRDVPSCSSNTDVPSTPSGTTASPPTTSSRDPQCPSDGQSFLPVPGVCTKFYFCYGGTKVIKDCPDGLFWHQEISQCDYPQNTNCKQS